MALALKIGDRVMRSDAGPHSIPAYRAMRGTIVAMRNVSCDVQWDDDARHGQGPTTVPCSYVRLAEGT